MRGVYEANIKISGRTAAGTLVLIQAPSTKCVEILSASVTNSSNATNQQMECALVPVTTLGSPAGTAITPTKMEQGDQAAGSTVTGNLTTEPTTYSANTIGDRGATSLGGWEFAPVPEERPVVAAAASMGLKLLTTLTAADLECRVLMREIG